MSVARAIALGGLTVGALDLADALVFFGARGVSPVRIPQSIAAGLLGRAAFSGGAGTVLLGLCLHFGIATSIVALYVLAGRRLPALVRHPFVAGALYGVGAWLVMNAVVIPLSAAAGGGARPWPVIVNGILIHIAGVGIPAVLFARAAAPRAMHA